MNEPADLHEQQIAPRPLVHCSVCGRTMTHPDAGQTFIGMAIGLHDETPELRYVFNSIYPELVELKLPVLICFVCLLSALGVLDTQPAVGRWH